MSADTPRVEACINAVMGRFPSMSVASEQRTRFYQEVHQHLAPLAREMERELAAAVAAASIPPQQAPDPIYLIRPKAGGTTWTECISEQSYDAAMRLGVYESRVVVEVGGQEKSS